MISEDTESHTDYAQYKPKCMQTLKKNTIQKPQSSKCRAHIQQSIQNLHRTRFNQKNNSNIM